MGERCSLSGHIQSAWYYCRTDKDTRALAARNQQVISELPEFDEWPFLTRGMFAFSPNETFVGDEVTTTYRGQVIYFGGSFSKLYLEWHEWLEKFESLLRRLYWEHAAAVLKPELIVHQTYYWKATRESMERFSLTPPIPVQDWKFQGGPRSFR